MHVDIGFLPMEAGLFVSDVFDGESRQVRDVILRDGGRPARLARDDDPVGGGEGLASNPHVAGVPAMTRPELEERIDDFIGNPVAYFVRMTFGNRLAREQIARMGHRYAPPTPGQPASPGTAVSCSAAER